MADQKEQERSSIDELRTAIVRVAVNVGVYTHGVDYLLDNDFPPHIVEQFMEKQHEALVQATAQQLGMKDDTQLRSPETRTEEQQEAMIRISGAAQVQRLEKYLQSVYVHAIRCVEKTAWTYLDIVDPPDEEHEELISALLVIDQAFFAAHKELSPLEAGPLSPEHVAELEQQTKEFLDHQQRTGKPYTDAVWDYLSKTPHKFTEITRADKFSLPLAKAWRMENTIAMAAPFVQPVNVGGRTESAQLFIKCTISDRDGNPLRIDDLMKGVQRAVGNLIDEHHGVLPITVSPQQIYRAFARLPHDANVTTVQAAEMEAAMDELMFCPSSIDFQEQLARHRHIKQQSDYDYKGINAGGLQGNLITAEKGYAMTRNGTREVAYTIYNYPVFYRYSHIIGQIAEVPNVLITGQKASVRTGKKAGMQSNARNIAMRENVLTRVYRMEKKSVIRVDDVASDCGFELTAKTRRTLLDNMALYLEELKKQGTVKGYTIKKEGKKIAGYEVTP